MTDFLNLEQVNQIISAGLGTFETKISPGKELSIGSPEVIKTSGAYGSVILCALFTGGVEGRLTWTMEWGAGFAIAEVLSGKKVDGFNEQTQQALEGLFHDFLQGVANGFSEKGTQLDIRVLPTLVDTSVLLSEDGNPGAIKIPFNLEGGSVVNLFLSLQEGHTPVLPRAAAPELEAPAEASAEMPVEVPAEEVPVEAAAEVPAEVLAEAGPEGEVVAADVDPAAAMASMEVAGEPVAEVSAETGAELEAPPELTPEMAAQLAAAMQPEVTEAPVEVAAEGTENGGDGSEGGTPPAAAA